MTTEIIETVRPISYYSLHEIARMTGLSYETIRRHVYAGKLVAHKPGRDWLVSHDSLTAWMKTRKVHG